MSTPRINLYPNPIDDAKAAHQYATNRMKDLEDLEAERITYAEFRERYMEAPLPPALLSGVRSALRVVLDIDRSEA
jgi:hypothetical protein